MLSRQSLDILIDLIEIKLSAIIVQDKDDLREVMKLRKCRRELMESRKKCAIHHVEENEELPDTKGILSSVY
ncbi:MAG: hypothetical protein K6C34_01655 [Alphaproteobacteria bacterium]|nr:hypothetical protein [Alphaproteobacteria bacterium]